MDHPRKAMNGSGQAPAAVSLPDSTRSAYLQRMVLLEFAMVLAQVRLGQRWALRPFALALNHLGNGWLYPIVALALWLWSPPNVATVVITACLAAAVTHLVYPWIKRSVARPRPCEVDQEIPTLLRAMDRYSFPSGHCMTVAAVAVPISTSYPVLSMPSVMVCLANGWARLVAAHHYPSDIIAGVTLGALVATPLTVVLLS